MRICNKCKTQTDEFYDEKTVWCKSCHRAKAREWIQLHPERARAKDLAKMKAYEKDFLENGVTLTEKKCSLCKKIKVADDFPLCRFVKGGLHNWCKECSTYRQHYLNSRGRDKKKGFSTCTREEWESVRSAAKCIYCGYEGVVGCDRIDNSKGHELVNIVPCCNFCNIARSDHFTVAEMKQFIGPAIHQIRLNRAKSNA